MGTAGGKASLLVPQSLRPCMRIKDCEEIGSATSCIKLMKQGRWYKVIVLNIEYGMPGQRPRRRDVLLYKQAPRFASPPALELTEYLI